MVDYKGDAKCNDFDNKLLVELEFEHKFFSCWSMIVSICGSFQLQRIGG